MSDDDTEKTQTKLSDSFASGEAADYGTYLFKPEELDIYANKLTCETFIFHSKKVDYEVIDHLEYDPDKHTLTIHRNDRKKMDLGVKIQWLVRPYITKTNEVSIVRTRDGVSIDGTVVPLVQKGETA